MAIAFLIVIYCTIWTFARQVEVALFMKYWNMTTADLPSGYWQSHLLISFFLSLAGVACAAPSENNREHDEVGPLAVLVLALVAPSFVFVFYIGIPWTINTIWAGLSWLVELAGIELS